MSARRRPGVAAHPIRSPPSLLTPPPSQSSRSSTAPTATATAAAGTKRKHSDTADVPVELAANSNVPKKVKTAIASKRSAPEADSDGDIEMEDAFEERKSSDMETHEQKQQPEMIESDSDSDDEYDENPVSDIYQPTPAAAPEVVNPSDPFSSVEHRMDEVLHRLSPLHLPPRLPGLETQQKELHELLSRTMESSINNAALILGPHGSGCSTLVEICLRDLRKEYLLKGKSFVIVRLNGKIQTDDTLAMREIVFQVCRDHELEQFKENIDFYGHLNFLIEILNQGTFNETPILFLLDEFQLFTQRAKQTLLYNLCDLLQSSKAQLCLIGLSSQMDCYDRLEKRIRSRMSHRRILIGTRREHIIDSQGQIQEIGFNLKKDQAKKEEVLREILSERLILPEVSSSSTPRSPEEKKSKEKPEVSPAIVSHNESIRSLLSPQQSPRLHALLSFHVHLNGLSLAAVLRIFSWSIGTCLSPRHPYLVEEDLVQAFKYHRTDWIREGLKHCTVLELTLLASMVNLSRRHIFYQNFTQIYGGYTTFYNNYRVANNEIMKFDEVAALKAFENLLEKQHLVVWAENPPTPTASTSGSSQHDPAYTGTGVQRRFLPVRLLLSDREFQSALKQRLVDAPTWLVLWAGNRSSV